MLHWTTHNIGDGVVIESTVVGFAAANCYLVACAETLEAAVVDPGTMDRTETARIVDEARRLRFVIRHILNTHGHPDHMSGNDLVKAETGGKVAIHELDALKLTDPVRNASRLFGMDIRVSPADRLLSDGETVSVGKLGLGVVHAPGHSSGGVVFVGDGFVLTGDTLFAGSIGRSDLPHSVEGEVSADEALIASIRDRILTLPDDTVVLPGHGPATTIGVERRSNPFLA